RAVRFVIYALFGGVEDLVFDGVDLTQFIIDKRQLELYEVIRMSGAKGLTLNDLMSYETNPEVAAALEEGSKVSDENAQKVFDDCIKTIAQQSKQQRLVALARAIDLETDEDIKLDLKTQFAQLSGN
ncbi:MAG: hypothetical protein RR348_04915, partial [Clostridia bacterium]